MISLWAFWLVSACWGATLIWFYSTVEKLQYEAEQERIKRYVQRAQELRDQKRKEANGR